ncbi:DUF6750 family protein [Marinobacterium sp. BA1]|uniref:DUF6750 family protein n=1 Tax=Marinobacterium sp. BA1 TaxID=3138931 RepID=UPI0032E78836
MKHAKQMRQKMANRYYAIMAIATVTAMGAGNASAMELSDVISKTGGQFSDAGQWVQTIFGFLGFVLVGMGIWGLATRKDNPQKPVSHSIWFIVGGAFLLIIVVILQMVTQSTFSTSDTSLDRIGL